MVLCTLRSNGSLKFNWDEVAYEHKVSNDNNDFFLRTELKSPARTSPVYPLSIPDGKLRIMK